MPFLATKATFPGKEFLLLQAPFLVLGTSSLGPRDVKALPSGGPTFALGRTFLFLFMLLFSAKEEFRQMKLVCLRFFL